MARHRLEDYLQTYTFWLIDTSPSTVAPFFVLGSPLLGFSAISTPEITVTTREIPQLNSLWKHHTIESADVSPITLSRGSKFYDATFYQWIKRSVDGLDVPQRNLLLIHFHGQGFTETADYSGGSVPGLWPDIFEGGVRIPGRAWMLWDCIPTRYKAGQDFDATSGEVSILELEVKPVFVEEYSVGGAIF